MAEFSSLNGYQVKDTVARGIAKGRNQAVAFVDYATMIETLNELEKEEYKAGQNVYIGVVGVPDLWVYGVEDIRHTFTYVSDEDFVEMLKTNTTVQVGFFKLAMLEGQKVDLTTYDQHLSKHDDDIAELNESVDKINVYVGEDKKIHFVDSEGADSVLPFNSKPINLGEGTSFNVSSYDGYENFTNDNFIIETIPNGISGSSGSFMHDVYSMYLHNTVNKSYNASTGVLTANEVLNVRLHGSKTDYTTTYSRTVNVRAWLVL